MKKSYYLISIVLICMVILLTYLIGSPRHPSIHFPKGTYDNFGELKEGEVLVYSFPFENCGNEKLEIKNIKTNCGCISAKCEQPILKKGESSNIKIVYRSEISPSEKNKIIRISFETNDPKNSFAKLQLEGMVIRTLYWYPRSLSFYCTQDTTGEQQDVRFKTDKDQQLEVEKIEVSSDRISASYTQDKTGIVCSVYLDPNCPQGSWGEKIELFARIGNLKKKVLIPVYLMIQ
ncbi:DUF1573 domain-containing protein [Planctomycetota bacterium]